MTPATDRAAPLDAAASSGTGTAQMLTRRLAACGFSVHRYQWRDRHELVILNVACGRSCLTLIGSGHARWHYEPPTGPGTDPATLTAIILHILGTPHTTASTPRMDPYRAFPLKGAVGRYVQDRGLTVALRVSEDLESFEATTDIEITSPARPWLGLVRLSDDGHLEWDCDWRTAFHGDPGKLTDVIVPIFRAWVGYARTVRPRAK